MEVHHKTHGKDIFRYLIVEFYPILLLFPQT